MKIFGDYHSKKSNIKPEVEFNHDKYNPITNSCVDFTWKALQNAGLNPDGFEGDLLPINNINNF